MKLIIDIDNKLYKGIQTIGIPIGKIDYVLKAIKNSTPIPDNATNGDVIKAMFGKEFADKCIDYCNAHMVGGDWWNAPYQKGGTTRKNCEYRHENGNCLAVGGFCTSIDDEHCQKGGKE